MIMSYPPKIRQRVEELPQYKETIKQRGKIHIGKKILGLIFFVIMMVIRYLLHPESGLRFEVERFLKQR